jgi:GT2 family glycosyltransferase
MAARTVAVVVPVLDRWPLTERFLEGFARVRGPSARVVVVDHGSLDGTPERLAREHPGVEVLHGGGELFWTGATNVGVRWALARRFDYVLTINNDAVVTPDFLEHLVAAAEKHPRAIVGCRIDALQEPSRVWACGGEMRWEEGRIFELHDSGRAVADVLASRPNPFEVDILTGCGTLVPSRCFEEVGLYDARSCPHYHADSELVLRARRRGYRALVALDAVIYNDLHTTWHGARSLGELVFSLRSAEYWRAIVKIHLAHCPRRWLPYSLAARYLRHTLDAPARERVLAWVRPRP